MSLGVCLDPPLQGSVKRLTDEKDQHVRLQHNAEEEIDQLRARLVIAGEPEEMVCPPCTIQSQSAFSGTCLFPDES